MAKISRNLTCPFCGKVGIRSWNGLSGHIQMAHPEAYPEWRNQRKEGIAPVLKTPSDVTITMSKEANTVKVIGKLEYHEGIIEEILAFWNKYSQ